MFWVWLFPFFLTPWLRFCFLLGPTRSPHLLTPSSCPGLGYFARILGHLVVEHFRYINSDGSISLLFCPGLGYLARILGHLVVEHFRYIDSDEIRLGDLFFFYRFATTGPNDEMFFLKIFQPGHFRYTTILVEAISYYFFFVPPARRFWVHNDILSKACS